MWLRRGVCIEYDKIRSMSGRYESYWNAFLFVKGFEKTQKIRFDKDINIIERITTFRLEGDIRWEPKESCICICGIFVNQVLNHCVVSALVSL